MTQRHAIAGLLVYLAAMVGALAAGLGQAVFSVALGGPLLQPMQTIGAPICLGLIGAGLMAAPFALVWLAYCAWRDQ